LKRWSSLDFTSVGAVQPRVAHQGVTHTRSLGLRGAPSTGGRSRPSIMGE